MKTPQVLRLVVNPKETTRVRAIFDLYLEHQALLPVVRDLERRGWRTKVWVTSKGRKLGGQPFVKTNLHKLLTNATYAGKLRYNQPWQELNLLPTPENYAAWRPLTLCNVPMKAKTVGFPAKNASSSN